MIELKSLIISWNPYSYFVSNIPKEEYDGINKLVITSFEFDFFGHDKKIFDEFHGGGFLISNEISIKDLKVFFEKNKESYDKLTLEHIKKINQYKKLEKIDWLWLQKLCIEG